MNGAIAVPSVRTIRVPKSIRKKTIGASQNFLRTFIKSQNSANIDNLDTNTLLFHNIKIASHNLDLIHLNYRDYSSMY